MIGYNSDMMWLPEHGVGAVILTNADPGWAIAGNFRRKLLEVLFDGKPEADDDVAAAAKAMQERIAAERKLLTVPPDPARGREARRALRERGARRDRRDRTGDKTVFDFGEWKSEVASRKQPRRHGLVPHHDRPGFDGLEFVVGGGAGKRTLVFRDAQHEYTFTEK